jgi:hypothetical protein
MASLPRVSRDMFRFSTTENADLHTATLHAFGEANERLETALSDDMSAKSGRMLPPARGRRYATCG